MVPSKTVTPSGNTSSLTRRSRFAAFTLGLALIAATFAAHFPAVNAGYIWDDDHLLYQNPLILKPDGLRKLWFGTESPDYWPLTATTFWIEWRIWGNHPKPYHVTNIILHALSAVLVWRILKRLNFNNLGALLGGLIFAVHPITVESVAWISERKNVLSMVFYLLAVLSYLRFEDRGSQGWYAIALLAAIAALLAKTSVVMLPVILLLLCWWRHNSLTRRTVISTMPFFLISLVFGLITVWFQHNNAIAGEIVRPEGLASRIASMGWVAWFYLYKAFVPINLAMVYPRWDIDGGRVLSYVPLALLLACLTAIWVYRRTWGRGPLVALAAFFIILAPVLGLVSMSYARYSLVADHLQYPGLPGLTALIGGALGAAWAVMCERHRRGPAAGIAMVASLAVLALAMLTWRQAAVYKNSETLWTHTLRINDLAWMGYNNRGKAYADRGAYELALRDYNKAIELKPEYAEHYNNRGNALDDLGDHAQAIRDFDKAIELKPGYAPAYNNRGVTLATQGDPVRGIRDLTQAIKLQADYVNAYYNRGNSYLMLGDPARAIQDFNKAIELNPDFAQAYNNRGTAYGASGDIEQALRDHTKAIELKPDFASAYGNRALDFYSLQKYDQAWSDVERCRRLGGEPRPWLVEALIKVSPRTELPRELVLTNS